MKIKQKMKHGDLPAVTVLLQGELCFRICIAHTDLTKALAPTKSDWSTHLSVKFWTNKKIGQLFSPHASSTLILTINIVYTKIMELEELKVLFYAGLYSNKRNFTDPEGISQK